jgi:GNAT superfamily N-acetyltransferase
MIRAIGSDSDLELCAEIAGAVEQTRPMLELMRRVRNRLLLDPDGGYAYVDRSSVPGSAFAMVRVLPDRRRRGIGSALLEAASASARTLGSDSAWGYVRAGDEESLRFAARHGFGEVGREVELRRRLALREGTMPDGIVELREEHRARAYAVAVAAVRDMPTAGDAEARPFDEWVERELSGPIAFAALRGGTVIGYATLQALGDERHRLEHGFTGVLPEYRRRGFATALGRAQIAWAAARGYEELVTTTGVANVALRRQKAKFGYVELDGPILVRGPV